MAAAPMLDTPRELLRRDERNPVLTVRDLPHLEGGVFNPGAVLVDGETLLLVRVEDRRGISHLAVARSADGVTRWRVEERPAMVPAPGQYPEEAHGIENPRITYLPALERYAIAYTASSSSGPLVALATTPDFKHFERLGAVLPPDNKDAAVFPVQFNGRWAMLHRPRYGSRGGPAHIWIAFSPDLKHWGEHRLVLRARHGPYWDAGHIGTATPPLLTSEGWLLLYHAVRETAGGKSYRLGLALLDAEDPARVVRRSSEWVLAPDAPYESIGRGGVVFPCGWVRDSENVRIYYGAGDQYVAVAHASVPELLEWLRHHCSEPDQLESAPSPV